MNEPRIAPSASWLDALHSHFDGELLAAATDEERA